MFFITLMRWGQRLSPYLVGWGWAALSNLSGGILPAFSAALTPTSPTVSLAQQLPSPPLADGIYYYGQSSQPDVIGQEYFIFQVRGNQIKGALFMPRSEFYCTTGTLSRQELALQVQDPYGEDPPSEFAIALVPRSPLAQTGRPLDVTLAGYQAITDIGENEQRILAACL